MGESKGCGKGGRVIPDDKISQTGDLSGGSYRRDSNRDFSTGNAPRKNRIHYSGPLMPPGGNLEDLLKEHEKQIQQAVRKARVEKSASRKTQALISRISKISFSI